MIIIGILAAIAIPTFLNQRKNGYRSALKADLKNAATALESAAVDKQGDYTLAGALAVGATLPGAGVEFTATSGDTVTSAPSPRPTASRPTTPRSPVRPDSTRPPVPGRGAC
jgi:type IV pilus assembly protein PilA